MSNTWWQVGKDLDNGGGRGDYKGVVEAVGEAKLDEGRVFGGLGDTTLRLDDTWER